MSRMSVSNFIGTWEIIKGIEIDNEEIKGVKFKLDNSGDVTWTIKDEYKFFPLFNCEIFELCSIPRLMSIEIILRFGSCGGHVIELILDDLTVDLLCAANDEHGEQVNEMHLECPGWSTLHCKRILNTFIEYTSSQPFTLLPALEEGYFHDVTLSDANDKEFNAHSCILQLIGKNIDWTNSPFSKVSEQALGTILHFLYTESLPPSLDDATARQVIEAIAEHHCLSRLYDLCLNFIDNTALKQRIILLVNDLEASLQQVIEHFMTNCAARLERQNSLTPPDLCVLIKHTVRDSAVVFAKFLLVCDLFTKTKNKLCEDERQEIILYLRSKVPYFLKDGLRFTKTLISTFGKLTGPAKIDVSAYLIPETKNILDTISALLVETEKAVQQIIQILSPQVKSGSEDSNDTGKDLKSFLRSRELSKLTQLSELITSALVAIVSKKENFDEMTQSEKVRSIARNFEQILEELPILRRQIEETINSMDDKLDMCGFKFCFKVTTSKVSGILQTLTQHRETLQDAIPFICNLVQRESFTQAMLDLELLEANSSNAEENSENSGKGRPSTPKRNNLDVESLSVPPSVQKSNLSKMCLQLLTDGEKTDMTFEIVPLNQSEDEDSHTPEEVCSIQAHRVIVAARCDWFRRALLSGMREDINRKIVIYDTSPFLFRVFLEYLYNGRITKALTTEHFPDLLVLSDRYEMDDLKEICEMELREHIDSESVLYYLGMADQVNAQTLLRACFSFIERNHKITDTEQFFELPVSLQNQVFSYLWYKPVAIENGVKKGTNVDPSNLGFTNLSIAGQTRGDLPSTDTQRLEACITQLIEVIGSEASRSTLEELTLAADYDVSRALNYYFNQNLRSST